MDINQLEVLVAVAREKSFSRAAETLHRTQPAVSQAIRRLETELGEPLLSLLKGRHADGGRTGPSRSGAADPELAPQRPFRAQGIEGFAPRETDVERQ